MSEVTATKLERLKWRLEWFLQIGLEWLISKLPGETVFRIGEIVGGLLWYVMGERRRFVIKNLRIAFAGEKSLEELENLARASFRRTAANLLSAVHMASLDLDRLEECVTVENPDIAEEAAKVGRGILVLPPHMGNWEILARMNRLYPQGYETAAFYRPLNNPYLDTRLAKKRNSEGTRLFSKGDNLLQVVGFLKSGGMIGILADQRVGRSGVVTKFFGRLTRSSPLPELLYRRCKCALIVISVRTVSPGKWSVRYHKVEEPADTVACMREIEGAMRISPVDVFWFSDRWKVRMKRGNGIREWLGEEGLSSDGRGYRALIWLRFVQAGWRIPLRWQHGDVTYEYVLEEGDEIPGWVEKSAEIHRVPKLEDVSEIRSQIERIDRSKPLPIDWILVDKDDRKLRAASSLEAIPLVAAQEKKEISDNHKV